MKLILITPPTYFVEENKIITDYRFLIGRSIERDIVSLNGELITKRNEKLANKILDQIEQIEFKNNPDILIKKWTKIEAYGKGIGIGFSFDLIKKLPNNINTMEIIDSLNNKYYYSIWIKE